MYTGLSKMLLKAQPIFYLIGIECWFFLLLHIYLLLNKYIILLNINTSSTVQIYIKYVNIMLRFKYFLQFLTVKNRYNCATSVFTGLATFSTIQLYIRLYWYSLLLLVILSYFSYFSPFENT